MYRMQMRCQDREIPRDANPNINDAYRMFPHPKTSSRTDLPIGPHNFAANGVAQDPRQGCGLGAWNLRVGQCQAVEDIIPQAPRCNRTVCARHNERNRKYLRRMWRWATFGVCDDCRDPNQWVMGLGAQQQANYNGCFRDCPSRLFRHGTRDRDFLCENTVNDWYHPMLMNLCDAKKRYLNSHKQVHRRIHTMRTRSQAQPPVPQGPTNIPANGIPITTFRARANAAPNCWCGKPATHRRALDIHNWGVRLCMWCFNLPTLEDRDGNGNPIQPRIPLNYRVNGIITDAIMTTRVGGPNNDTKDAEYEEDEEEEDEEEEEEEGEEEEEE